jgi:hypothetical protein
MKHTIALLAIAFALAGCSSIPLPIDLMGSVGERANGNFTASIPVGVYSTHGKLPEKPSTTDFGTQNIGINVVGGTLDYRFNLTYTGKTKLEGTVTAQVYIAPAGLEASDSLWQDRYKLGTAKTIVLETGKTSLTVDGNAPLNDTQVKALNDKKMRFGVLIDGKGSSSAASSVEFKYQLKRLTLNVALF